MAVYLASIVSLVLAALSLGPSYAHVLEALPRLTVWPAELWRDATVFHRQFEWYALIGAPVDVAAIIAAVALAFLVRDRKPMFRPAVVGAACLAAGLASWFGLSRPPTRCWQHGSPARFRRISMSFACAGKPAT
jgi:hypothetical protein